MKKRVQRLAALLAALAVCFTLSTPMAGAVTKSEINKLKQEASSLNNQKADLQKQLAELGEDMDQAMEKKEKLDEQCALIQSQIDNVSEQIKKYDQLIAQTQENIEKTEQEEKEKYEIFCKRVRAMEEQGKISYWEIIFRAENFSDLLSRIDFVNEIIDYDERIMRELKELREKLETEKETQETAKAEQVAAQSELKERRGELQKQLNEAEALMARISAQEDTYQKTLDELDEEGEKIQAEIIRKSQELARQEELARQQAAANGGTASNNSNSGGAATSAVVTSSEGGGGYIWPVQTSRKISSPMGGRASPGGIGSTNHKGVDISGVGYTSKVLATKAGTVIVSKYSKSYGNYVVVSHGSGNTTLYAHMSSRSVSEGQSVSQGQVLGITGCTGNSTGAHLHYEVTEGGARVNPLNYLAGYIKAWR